MISCVAMKEGSILIYVGKHKNSQPIGLGSIFSTTEGS